MQCSSQVKATTGIATVALSAVLAFTSFGIPAPAYAVSAAEKAAEAQSALTELYAMQETLTVKSNEYYASLIEYQKAAQKCDETQARIDAISKEIEQVQGRLGNRARDMYRHGSTSFLDLLLGAASFEEFTNNWDLLNRVNETDAELSSKARALRVETEEQKAILNAQAKVAEEKSAAAGAAYEDAQSLVVQMEATYNSLSAEAQELYAQEQAAAAMAAASAAAAAGGGGGGGYGYGYTDGGVMNDDGTVTDIATGQVYSSSTEYSAATGNAIVDRAMSMLGSGYRWGATGADGYFDCSGLVGYAVTGTYDRIGNTTTFMGYSQVSDPQPGDIVVSAGHTGIYIGDGQMVHARDESSGVVIGPVQDGMIYVRY